MRAAVERVLHDVWSHRGIAASLLYPFSLVYLAIARRRAARTTPVELPVPVVVVGNIYVGGTGKTPITIELVRELKAAGFTPGVISRGYGRASKEQHLVEDDSPASTVGDEPLLIRRATGVPVAVGRDRVAAGRLLIRSNPSVNVIVSDDGLQHRRLARDVELAVVGARGLGNSWALPAGPLRELPSRLDSVDAIVLSATEDTIESRTPRFAATSQLGDVVRLCDGNPSVNVIVSDDGLQHRRLARDVELAVVGARGLGNSWALPAGPLRELPSRLDSVDAIVLSATEDTIESRTPRFAATSQLGDVVRLCDGRRRSIEDISHRIAEKEAKALAAAGIAAPDRFFNMLAAHDIVGKNLGLGDHFAFDTNPFAQSDARYIFITGKDAVKAMQNPDIKNDRRIWVVEYQTQLDPYLIQFVVEKLTDAAERKHIDIVPPTEEITH